MNNWPDWLASYGLALVFAFAVWWSSRREAARIRRQRRDDCVDGMRAGVSYLREQDMWDASESLLAEVGRYERGEVAFTAWYGLEAAPKAAKREAGGQ